jgi:hypothetical protein
VELRMNQATVEVWDGPSMVATIHTTDDGVAVVSEGLAAIHCATTPRHRHPHPAPRLPAQQPAS